MKTKADLLSRGDDGFTWRKRLTVIFVALLFLSLSVYKLLEVNSSSASEMNMEERAFIAWKLSLFVGAVSMFFVVAVALCVWRSLVWSGILSAICTFVLYIGGGAAFQVLFGEESAAVVMLMAFGVLAFTMFLLVAWFTLGIRRLPDAALRNWFLQQLAIPGMILVVGMVLGEISAMKFVDSNSLTGTVYGVLITLLVIRQTDAAIKLFSDEGHREADACTHGEGHCTVPRVRRRSQRRRVRKNVRKV